MTEQLKSQSDLVREKCEEIANTQRLLEQQITSLREILGCGPRMTPEEQARFLHSFFFGLETQE